MVNDLFLILKLFTNNTMTTEKAFEQLKLAALEVKAALIDMDDNIQPSVSEVEAIIAKTNSLAEQLVIYKFLKTQKELSPNFNIHLKVMEQATAKEEKVSLENDVSEPVNSEGSTLDVAISIKKIELGLNDKFRIINELFNQNSTEFNLAMEQLNLIDSLQNSEAYLNELRNLYSWKNDHELMLRLFQLNQKRFL